jgi:hypothetical protein
MIIIAKRWIIIGAAIVLSACAHHEKIPPEEVYSVYFAMDTEDSLVSKYAPVFLPHDYRNTYNRIGRPSASYDAQGRERVYVDPAYPIIYYMKQDFITGKSQYTNLIYRVHFPKVPFRLIPFYLTAGKNVGIMVVVTLDSEQRPVLVSTVGTCGCYLAIVPTNYLPQDALPKGWTGEPLKVYGEWLPALLDYSEEELPRLLVYLRPGVHRIMDLDIISASDLLNRGALRTIQTPLVSMSELEKIPLNGETTSFYYDAGVLRGHVKGSGKPWETLFLGLISLDFFVGTDKVYADNERYGNPFYTSLKPWNRKVSDMSNFANFLEFWGWRL